MEAMRRPEFGKRRHILVGFDQDLRQIAVTMDGKKAPTSGALNLGLKSKVIAVESDGLGSTLLTMKDGEIGPIFARVITDIAAPLQAAKKQGMNDDRKNDTTSDTKAPTRSLGGTCGTTESRAPLQKTCS